MPFPSWLNKGFQKVYGAVDKNLAAGILPGGADSPYIGRSVNPRKVEQAQNFVKDYVAANSINALLDNANQAANKAIKRLEKNPATQIPFSTIEKVQAFLNPKLRTPVDFTGFTNQPNAFFNDENRVNVQGIVSDEARAKYMTDLGDFNKKISPIMRDLQNLPVGSNPKLDKDFSIMLEGKPTLKNYARYSAPIALHEFGHALNFADWSSPQIERNLRYGRTYIAPGAIGGLSAGRGSQDENRSLMQAGFEGLLANITAPGTRHTIAEEALASRNALKMANELGLPKGRRLLGAALGTYVSSPAAYGFADGVMGAIGSKAVDKFADFVTDNVIDPIGDRFRGSDYSGLEQKLRQYGYDESKHRLRSTGYSSPTQVEFK